MALSDSTLSLIAFKQLQGKSMTDINKGVGNEAEGIKLNVDSSTIFINEIDSIPATAVLMGVAEFVTADLTLDGTSNSQAYFATYPIGHPKAGQRVINAISPTYGVGYEAKPFAGVNPIPVNDPIDWIYQYQSGVFYFQDPGSLAGTPTTIDLYVYTGELLSDIVGNIQLEELDWQVTTADDLQMIPTGAVLPNLDDSNDLGSSSLRWKDIYLGSKIDFATDLEFNKAGVNISNIDEDGISLSLTKTLRSTAVNKSQISFGINGDEFIVSNDGGSLNDAYIILNTPNIVLYNTSGEFSSSAAGLTLRNTLKIDLRIGSNDIVEVDSDSLTIKGNTLGKYEVQPDTQPGFDDYTMVTKKWVEDLLGGSGTGANPDNVTIITNTAGELVAVNQVHTDNITITTNTAGELEVIGQPGEWGIKNHLVPTDIIDVSPNYQYLVYGNLTIEGIMNNAGEVVIINGTVILQGLGQFNNIDLGTLKLVNLATGVSMNAVVKTLNATANTPVTINHGLGTKDFIFSAREGNDMIDIGLTHVDDNNVSITTSANITSGSIIFQSKLV